MKFKTLSKGFTIVEVLVTIAIVTILTVITYQTLSGKKESGRMGNARIEITKSFPDAISALLVTRADCTGTTKALLTARGLNANNVLRQSWTVAAAAAGTVTITYPMEVAQQATDMAAIAGASSFINTATANGVNLSLVYSCL